MIFDRGRRIESEIAHDIEPGRFADLLWDHIGHDQVAVLLPKRVVAGGEYRRMGI